ncbi:Uncharacterised protein [Segatella copri]|nr:Uncharacterised protein [Segatella copri]
MFIDGVKASLAVLDRNVSKVYVHRIAWHILVEQIDSCSTMYGKVFDAKHRWHYFD